MTTLDDLMALARPEQLPDGGEHRAGRRHDPVVAGERRRAAAPGDGRRRRRVRHLRTGQAGRTCAPARRSRSPSAPAGSGRRSRARPRSSAPTIRTPTVDAERLRLLLREVFAAAGGTHDDWDAYDAEMVAQGRTAVLVTPTRVYSN